MSKDNAVRLVLAAITLIAVRCGEEDVSLVLGIVGSVLGCFVAYALPGVLKLSLIRQQRKAGQPVRKSDVVVNAALVAVGVVFGALGVWVTISTELSKPHHRSH